MPATPTRPLTPPPPSQSLRVRRLSPELIDTLPHDDPEAQWSRRDLVVINWLMGNWRWVARKLAQYAREGDRLLELGAGGGEFAAWWDRRNGSATAGTSSHPREKRDDLAGPITEGMRGRGGWSLAGLDLAPQPRHWRADRRWFQTDLLGFDDYAAFDVVFAVLTLHHFDEEQLRKLGESLRRGPLPRVIIATETTRRRRHLWQARALRVTGANRVTRHDALASIAAGFRDNELPELLGLRAPEWQLNMSCTFWGAYRLVAVRRPT